MQALESIKCRECIVNSLIDQNMGFRLANEGAEIAKLELRSHYKGTLNVLFIL